MVNEQDKTRRRPRRKGPQGPAAVVEQVRQLREIREIEAPGLWAWVKPYWLALPTYAGATTAVVASDASVRDLNVFNPQTPADLVALLGLGVAVVSLVVNAWLRWQSLRTAQAALDLARAQAFLAEQAAVRAQLHALQAPEES